MSTPTTQSFRPRARLMLLLGDQLIRDAGVAVVELVKNAYDADATHCRITLSAVDGQAGEAVEGGKPRIVIEDDGHGMDLDTVLGVWLEPGTEHRRAQKARGRRTRKFKRLPLGEKGVGRFAVHKLGRRVRLITRRPRGREIVIDVDWRRFEAERYLDDVELHVSERRPEIFRGRRTGTRIEISDLRDLPWSRAAVQGIQRAITSICSPFDAPDSFRPELAVEPSDDWLAGISTADQVLRESLFRFRGTIRGGELSYDYEFVPVGALDGVARRTSCKQRLKITASGSEDGDRRRTPRRIDLDAYRIGTIGVDFHIFHRDPVVLRLVSADPPGLRDYLDKNGGVRAYRDGVRIYDFGEPGNDWLGLGSRRASTPARRIGNHQILGAVHLELAASTELVEKTNREGFVENGASQAFREAIVFALSQAEAEREVDKARIQRFYSRTKGGEPVIEEIAELRGELERAGLAGSLAPNLARIESQYRKALDQLLTAAGTGLNLAAALHEIDRGLDDLRADIERGVPRGELAGTAAELCATVDSLAWLTRRSSRGRVAARELVRHAIANSEFRFREHRIDAVDGMTLDDPDFRVHCDRRLVIAALMNLIDNSIYWLGNKGARSQRIYVGTTYEVNGLPALVVADNGPGFADEPGVVVQPFFTRKPQGTGLGLHIAAEVMRSHGGQVLFPARDEVTLPRGFGGAIVALEFAG